MIIDGLEIRGVDIDLIIMFFLIIYKYIYIYKYIKNRITAIIISIKFIIRNKRVLF